MSVTIIDRSSTGEYENIINIVTGLIYDFSVFFLAIVTPLTALMLVVLLKNRAYSRNPFFAIYKVGLVFDILSLLTMLVFRILPTYGCLAPFFTVSEAPARLTIFCLSFTRIGQGFTNVFICANRMSAILLPFMHEKIWNNSFVLPLCFCFQSLFGCIVGWRACSFDFHWLRYPQGQMFVMLDTNSGLPNFWRSIFIPVAVVLIALIALYICAFFKFRIRMKPSQPRGDTVDHKLPTALFIISNYSIVVEIAYIITFFHNFIFVGNHERDERISFSFIIVFRICYSAAPCFLLWVFCSSVRSDIRRFVTRKNIVTLVSTIHQQSI